MSKPISLVFVYIYLAASCTILGIGITFALLLVCQYFSIDLFEKWWLLGIPVTLAVLLNIIFIELYRKFNKR